MKKRVILYLDGDLLERVGKEASNRGWSVSQYTEDILSRTILPEGSEVVDLELSAPAHWQLVIPR